MRCALRSAGRFPRRINRLAHQPNKLQATDRFSPLSSNLDPLALEVLDRDGQLGTFVVLIPPSFFELDRVELGIRLGHVGFPLALKKNSTRKGVQVSQDSRRRCVSRKGTKEGRETDLPLKPNRLQTPALDSQKRRPGFRLDDWPRSSGRRGRTAFGLLALGRSWEVGGDDEGEEGQRGLLLIGEERNPSKKQKRREGVRRRQ